MVKRIMVFSLVCICISFLLPTLLRPSALSAPEASPTPEPTASPQPQTGTDGQEPPPAQTQEPTDGESVHDRDMQLSVQTADGVQIWTMAEYLPRALGGEMPAAFDEEALKAQAVALRSYALCCSETEKAAHPEADVCMDAGCCTSVADESELKALWGANYEKYYEKICRAVADTDGQYLVYGDEPILAVFHSSSSGFTEDAGNIWSAKPYLVSVSSPETEEDVSNLISTVEVSTEDFRKTVQTSYSAALEGDAGSWLGETVRGSSGRVRSIRVGGAEISGTAMRSMFSLRSTNFDVAYNGTSFVFTVRGYGHGVGMSQYGANVMAKTGANYAEILAHYYPGTELVVSMIVSGQQSD